MEGAIGDGRSKKRRARPDRRVAGAAMIAVLQGRVASARLPGKGFFTFFGETIWERMCRIAADIAGVDEVVFATGSGPQNEFIRPFVERRGARWFAGDENDVLGRFLGAVDGYSGAYLLRITCDNYLIQPDVVEGLIAAVDAAGADYGYVAPLSHFSGEVVRIDALRANRNARPSPQAREHVTFDVRADPSLAKAVLPADYLGLDHERKLTLDTLDDMLTMKKLELTRPDLEPLRCLDALRAVCARA